MRIIVSSVPECYTALGLLHTHFKPIHGAFDDYIGLPKDNGYQSLHTCVYPVREISHKPIEFQVRTGLMHMEAEHGNPDGVNPGALGRFQDVKKNTISALLKGLEESGLVERIPHPTDGRASLVRISPLGSELVRSTAPLRFRFMNEVTSSLSPAEQDELVRLLTKLHVSLSTHVDNTPCKEIK